jgi:hypothetical protein
MGNNHRTKPQTKKKELTPMKTVIKTSIRRPFLRSYFILTAIALGLLALCPKMQAVSPPPDGGYPGANTAEGQDALLSLTTGGWNTAMGFLSLRTNTTGQFNTGVGAATLYANTGDQNTATGAGALLSNTTGSDNTANGAFALFSNTTGMGNTAQGVQALYSNGSGNFNEATGDYALFSNTTGHENTATGDYALNSNTTGSDNTANGSGALASNTTGDANTANGWGALQHNTTGEANTANGLAALGLNTTGANNTAIGFEALRRSTTGGENTAIGVNALSANITGSFNIALGVEAGENVTSADNVICIGANVAGNNINDACYIGNIFGSTSSNGVAVLVNSNGRLGTMTSSARFKEAIKPMDKASEALYSLKPVSFRYKKEFDPAGSSQLGLVAEDVEKIDPDLVVRDKEGKPYSVRYDQVNAMLLNEFLKEHKRVEKLEAIAASLGATVKEQAVQIQKVSARLEVSERRSRTALNDPQNDRGR